MSTTQNVPSEQSICLSGPGMSRLLGISLIEYYNLNHDILRKIKDSFNNIIYQMKIDEHNDADLLRKLNMDEHFTVSFSVQDVETAIGI